LTNFYFDINGDVYASHCKSSRHQQIGRVIPRVWGALLMTQGGIILLLN